jgi:hypothetical protein
VRVATLWAARVHIARTRAGVFWLRVGESIGAASNEQIEISLDTQQACRETRVRLYARFSMVLFFDTSMKLSPLQPFYILPRPTSASGIRRKLHITRCALENCRCSAESNIPPGPRGAAFWASLQPRAAVQPSWANAERLHVKLASSAIVEAGGLGFRQSYDHTSEAAK